MTEITREVRASQGGARGMRSLNTSAADLTVGITGEFSAAASAAADVAASAAAVTAPAPVAAVVTAAIAAAAMAFRQQQKVGRAQNNDQKKQRWAENW